MRIVAIFIPTLLFLCGVVGLATDVHAQVQASSDLISVEPASPAPYEPVTVTIVNAANLPNGTTVRWFIDGDEVIREANQHQLSLTVKGMGEVTQVEALINSPQTGQQSAVVTISPIRLDLIVNANSHTPSFYKGRALPSSNSQISVRALVFGDDGASHSYYWRVNGQNVSNRVGNTANNITFKPGLDSQMYVELEIYDRNSELVAQKSLSIPLVEPEIHFYESNPLHGLIPNVLRSPYFFLNQEITLRGEPFYFSGSTDVLDIDWEIDRQSFQPNNDPFELDLIKTRDSGSARVELEIINTDAFLETASTEIQINY